MGRIELAHLTRRYPKILAAVTGWKLTAYPHNKFLKWTHPKLPVTLEAMTLGVDDRSFGITVGLQMQVVKIAVPRAWDADAFQSLILAVLTATVFNERQAAERGRHGLVEIVEASETVSASWGPLLRYNAVCECGWKSGECYPTSSASAAHQDHVIERCGAH